MNKRDHDVLDRALDEGRLVRLRRTLPGAERLEGFVLHTGPIWTLLANCADHQLDGWTAVHTCTLHKVRDRGGEESLTIRALRGRGLWPLRLPPADLPLDDHAGLLAAASAEYGLVSLHAEHIDPGILRVGTVTELRPRSLRLHEVDTEARWYPKPGKYRLNDITRVDFGTYYTEVLREFAGPRPERNAAEAGSPA
ncbi:hypothetical protein [Kitasatospora sp. SUK 42]|uniref:hypothetical protein n=1 Tax=Kitasatospora sp. SUK 42 TaxID=1588882 RepID=UPI0018C9A050|nr:hypothetical protein [Kitasatospora sp. SUK 42]MBV2151496.1 hypothetical protein [Kitasatospora sp. SUK 42]